MMRDGVGSHGLGCWPVARKSRSAVAKRAIPATTINPPAASVSDRGSGKRSGRTTESIKIPTSREPRKTKGGGKRTRAPPYRFCTEEFVTSPPDKESSDQEA